MDYTQILQQAGLPVVSAIANPDGSVNAQFTRPLTADEWSLYLSLTNPKEYLATRAAADFAAIPNWADITKEQFQTWWNANLSDAQVDAFAIPAGVKAMLKAQNLAIYRMGMSIIAMRNHIRILR